MYEQFTDEDIDQQVRIKEELDPSWLLNPGKVFPIEGRDAQNMRSIELTNLGTGVEEQVEVDVEIETELVEGREAP